ncbi:Serine/threonine-protein kinase ENV7 [Grifola frondosa]|uniref:non-specific serine/threonine protein kinase n=1 Tax=Grifola frondosa TaxID=5627 RepID=A0A1C7M657_GRIFR|nr:Serine/threonine-protein kinase ENV7 [Grifola frondosa]
MRVKRTESLKFQLKDAFWALSSCICQQSAKVKINGRTFKIIKVLGEGGFSFVYLAQDEHSGRQFALKKIRCPSGSEDVRQAMREVEAYRRFKHPNIIRILCIVGEKGFNDAMNMFPTIEVADTADLRQDSAVVQDPNGDGQIVYLFLPLYKRGNLQDAINANSINGNHFSELEMLRLFKGTCEAIRAMHDYRAPIGSRSEPFPSREDQSSSARPRDVTPGIQRMKKCSLIRKETLRNNPNNEVVFDGDEELSQMQHSGANGHSDPSQTELVPFAHRDMKPGNVMIADDGQPILMDFGSTMKAHIKIENRSQALLQQVRLTWS